MNKKIILILLLIFSFSVLPFSKPIKEIKLKIPLVKLNVYVTDKKGNLIKGLKANNFKIYEDGKLQKITNFYPDESNINLVFLIENTSVVEDMRTDFIYGVREIIRSLKRDDYASLITFDIKPTIRCDFTKEKKRILDIVDMITFSPVFRNTALFDSIYFTLKRLEDVKGKTAIVLMATGFDTVSKLTYGKMLKIVASSNTPIFSISIGQFVRAVNDLYYTPAQRLDFKMADVRLKYISRYSGGVAFYPMYGSEFHSIGDRIAKYLRHQYTIGYVPSNQNLKKKKRKIEVKCFADINGDGKLDSLIVHTKKFYYVGEVK